MREQELWEEVHALEEAMKEMHTHLDTIITGCSGIDGVLIRNKAYDLKVHISRAFEGKFPLVEAIRSSFQ